MKNKFILATLLLATTIVFAQKKDKISGNKIVVDVFKTLEGFNKLQIEDNLKVNIAQTLDNGYHLKTDENLVEVVRFEVIDDAKFDLDITTETAMLFLNNGTKGDLLLKGNKVKMILNENAYLKGDLVSDELEITVNKRADLDLSGDVTHLQLTATGSSDIKAKKLRTTYANLNGSNSADIYINTTKELELYMQGKSDVYVYGNPEIKVTGMNDKSKIIKK